MALIGEELFAMLGLVPSRDRAGIARGTMADEARASIAANSGNAEGQALTMQGTMQGARPPDFELPADIPTAYAAGKQRAAPYGGGPSIIPSVIPPAPSERVVASGPAAAPPPEVTRNSDIILRAIEKRNQMARLQQIIGSVGMIANAFNRNPDSQAATKASLAGMVGGGGGGGSDELGTLKSILEMRDAETLELKTVPELQRMFGWSEDRARAAFRSGEYKNWINPQAIQQREKDSRAQRTRMDLMKPEVVEALMKRFGQPREVIEAGIRDDKIDPKAVADILETQSQTAERVQKTGVEAGNIMSYDEAKANPAEFMRRYGIDSLAAAERATANRPAYDQFTKDRSGATTPSIQGFEYDRARAREQGPEALKAFDTKYPDVATYDRTKAPDRVASPGDTASAGIIGKVGGKYADWSEEVEKSNIQRESTSQELFKSWRPDIRAGGAFAEKENQIKKTLARAFGREDMAGASTDKFFAILNNAASSIADRLPGALSDKDVRFIQGQIGNKEMSPETLRKLIIINDNIQMAQDEEKRELIRRAQQGDTAGMDPETAKALKRIPVPTAPKPNWFVTNKLANDPEEVALIVKNRDNPEFLAEVDHQWGRAASRHVIDKFDREQAAKGGR